MNDLIAFLSARLDEDEAAARSWLPLGNPTAAQREHIARHDPARVLREVEAGRRLMEEVSSRSTPDVAEIYLAALASIWSGHPDYRPEWKP